MQDIMTTRDLIKALVDMPQDAPVMIAVVKYPEEFPAQGWLNSTAVECHPLEEGEINLIDGMVHIAVELIDYDEQRHFAGG